MRIEAITDVVSILGESPFWDADGERIYWVDSFGRAIHHCRADGRDLRRASVPANIGSMVLDRDGHAIAAMKTGVHRIELATGELECLHVPEAHLPDNTLNDGKVDRKGRFWFGSMNIYERQASGMLYRLDPDFSVHRMDRGITISNGPCFSPDNHTFYFSDSTLATVFAYDFDLENGTLANKRVFLKVADAGSGLVDGATVDSEGCYWCAHVYSGRIARYAPDGSLDYEIRLPCRAVTSVMFGGPDLDILYVTSMEKPLRKDVPPGEMAGRLFAIHGLGIRGIAEPKFGYQ